MKQFKSITGIIQEGIAHKMHTPIFTTKYKLPTYYGKDKQIVDSLYPPSQSLLLKNNNGIIPPDFNINRPFVLMHTHTFNMRYV